MKQYVIDELRLSDYEKLKKYMDENFKKAGVEGLYWILIDDSFLNDIQKEHNECKPFYFAVELLEDRLICEFLIRSSTKMRCGCISYAEESQRNRIIGIVDSIFEKCGIIT